jgi:hypothetical protein
LATWAIKHDYCTARQVAVLARLAPTRKTGYWMRHLRDLKWFMQWRDQQDQDGEGADEKQGCCGGYGSENGL